MADPKPVLTKPELSITQLGEALDGFERADTPTKLLRLVTEAVIPLAAGPVSVFAYGPTGVCDFTDEHGLPAPLRGHIRYPELYHPDKQPPAELLKNWAASNDAATAMRAINHGATGAATPAIFPLVGGQELLGGVVIWGETKTGPDTSATLKLLVRAAAGILLRIHLADEVKNNLARTMTLQRITQSVSKSLDFDQVGTTLLRHARKLFHVDAVALALAHHDKKRHEFYINQALGLSDEYIKAVRVPFRMPIVQQLVKSGTPFQMYDAAEAPLTGDIELVAKEGVKSVLLAPIFSGGEPVGALALISKRPRHFTDSELHFSGSLAEQAGIAFANANLHAGLRKASNEIEQTRNLMRDGLLVLDLERRLRYFNAAAGSLLKLNSKHLLASFPPPPKTVPGGPQIDRQQMTTAIDAAITGEFSSHGFADAHKASTQHYEAIYSPYRDAKGALVGVLVNIRDITSLYLEKDKLQTIQNNIQDGLILLDQSERIASANDEWRRLFDLDQPLLGQRFFSDLVPHAGIQFDRDPATFIEEVYNGKRVTTYAHLPSTGRHIQLSIGPITTANQITGAVATARDITPLIEKTVEANEMAAKAQTHLRELSQLAELSSIVGFNVSNIYQKYLSKTATLLGSTSVGIYLYQPSNQSLVRRGASNPDTADVPVIELGSPHPVARAFATRRAITSGDGKNTPHQLSTPITHHSKTLGVLLIGRASRPYGEHEGRLARLVATRLAILIENASLYHDVNARRERWEAVFRFTDEGIVIFDRSGTIVGFNPASTEITGFSPAEAIGKGFGKIIRTAVQGNASIPPLTRVLGEGVTITKSEQLLENRTGNRVWAEISYSPIFDDAGRVTSGLAIIRNTTRDREIEEIKSDFISIVSHELRTPLTAIKGFLSMTLKSDFGALTEKQYHYLSRVYQSNQRMINLVEDLMDVTYIESGKISLNIGPVAMESIISEVVSELAAKGAANQIMINVRRRQRLPLVLADETRLHQIVLNLVDNAIKYSMPGTEVDIDFKIVDDNLITTVSDHGVGISKNQIDRLFTKFGRIFNPLSIQAGGTGLGLYIVRNLVESHNGRIWATSQEGKGSKFHFSLPIAKQLPLLE